MTLETTVETVTQAFAKRFGRRPRWIAAAPGRVNLIGEHTDYNDGFVFPMAIERHVVIAADPAPEDRRNRITWLCSTVKEEFTLDTTAPIEKGEPRWSNYIRGVLAGFQRRGIRFGGFDAVMGSTVPIGGGLSSSAALEVAAATLLEIVSGCRLDPVEKALLCRKAEHEFAGVNCGIMDQFISVMGRRDHALLIDCRTMETVQVPMSDPSVSVLIFNTNVRRELSGSEYAERRGQCEEAAAALGVPALRDATRELLEKARDEMPPVIFKRARHVITENRRTTEAAAAIGASDWNRLGDLMHASQESLREDYEVSCPELDTVVRLARQMGPAGGVYGSRMTGAGFGGCTVHLVRSAAAADVARRLSEDYTGIVGIEPATFVSRPGGGAEVVRS